MSEENTEKKFTCTNCNYIAHVAGKRYYEIEWQFHIETRECKSCHRLFDNIVTKVVTEDEISTHSAEHYKHKNEEKENDLAVLIDEYISLLSSIKGRDKKIVNCRWCGSHQNQVWSTDKPQCPKCGEKMKVSKVKPFSAHTAENYRDFDELINSATQVVAFLTEPTCGICRNLQLIIEEIKKEYPDEFHFVEFDYGYAEENKLTSKYRLKFFPTFLHFKNGRYVGKFSNVESKPEFLKKLRKRFDKN